MHFEMAYRDQDCNLEAVEDSKQSEVREDDASAQYISS